MTPSQAIAWATQNQEATAVWLIEYPKQQIENDHITRELNEVFILLVGNS